VIKSIRIRSRKRILLARTLRTCEGVNYRNWNFYEQSLRRWVTTLFMSLRWKDDRSIMIALEIR